MKAGVAIDKIDTTNKIIKDSLGETHTFDSLILATGSRPFVPENAQLHLPGRFTVRRKEDADRLKKHLDSTNLPPEEQHVVIIGGGLLGLELAAALKHKKVKTTIIQRASRLMERQLDRISSKLLAEEVQLRDIQIYFDNEVSTVFETDNPNEIEIALKSGRIITANAIVYTIGTIPNIEIARESGLACGRGVKVNQYLQSSVPNVFAIGEIAEFNNQLFGITSAAEEQADVLANFMAGDISSFYKGSVLMNILKLEDINLCSIGEIEIPENDDSYEEIVFSDLGKRYYKKCVVKNDLLVGAILLAPFVCWSDLPLSGSTWGLLFIIGVVHTGLMSALLYGAIQKIPTSLVGALSFIYPVVAIIVDWLVFDHRLSAVQLAGAAAILLAAAGMNFGWKLLRDHPCESKKHS